MLLPDNIHPENSLYFTGSVVLSTVRQGDSWDLLELYSRVKAINEITMPIFILSLDWLFLLNAIKINDNGQIIPCT